MRLNRKQFEAWLRAQPAAEIVGHNRGCHDCPITNFYTAASGGHEIVISNSGGTYLIDRGDGDRRLPLWAENFAWCVDRREDCGDITAARALEVLTQEVE